MLSIDGMRRIACERTSGYSLKQERRNPFKRIFATGNRVKSLYDRAGGRLRLSSRLGMRREENDEPEGPQYKARECPLPPLEQDSNDPKGSLVFLKRVKREKPRKPRRVRGVGQQVV